jgi:predicted nucleotidyltransferase
VVLVFGSHLKGYGAHNADIDLAVFVKPGTLVSDRARVQERLKEVFVYERIHGDIVEFWLKDRNEELEIIDFKKPDSSLGESWWVHILFGAAWLGEENATREIRSKLLVPYMRNSGKQIDGTDALRIWLEEMESDVLQYRLMHKGYANFYPACGGINTDSPDRIDGQSLFWDSGYRQLATRLFVSMVFLPTVPGL